MISLMLYISALTHSWIQFFLNYFSYHSQLFPAIVSRIIKNNANTREPNMRELDITQILRLSNTNGRVISIRMCSEITC